MDFSKMHKPVIIGTRDSKMAMQMAQFAAQKLKAAYPAISLEIKGYTSDGDKFMGDLSKIGGKGAFVRNLDEKLLTGDIDCAVHSLKDIPGDVPCHEDLKNLAMMEREDPRDCLVMREGTSQVESHHVLATSSPRRRAFLKKLYPENKVIPLRGNVNTRLRKLQEGEFDGMVLSYAGLMRLDLQHHATKIFSPSEFLPAIGQGVICLKVRKEDVKTCDYLRTLNNTQAEMAVRAEREMLWILKGDCHSAIAGYCTLNDTMMRLTGIVAAADGSRFLEAVAEQSLDIAPEELGRKVAADLLAQGARELLGTCESLLSGS
ncbi:MAG: hydroxymethylbilane synthase [Rhodospirillales bacterium]|nr:hydroxymethylbilane synthase [Rhodospirillales bacterium]